MRILVIHQNFPGQFVHVARAWSRRADCEVVGLGRDGAPGLAGVRWYRYRLQRQPDRRQHGYLRQMESAVLHGQAVARALIRLRQKGFAPDVVLAHPGWGETLYLKDVFPEAHLIHFCEWYYPTGSDEAGFDPEFPVTLDDRARLRTWNALHALNLTVCDRGVSPTRWQRDRHPEALRGRIFLAHEGVDVDGLAPDPQAEFRTPNGVVLRAGDPVVTYVARNLEPYRGFHRFMRAWAEVQRRMPRAHAVIVGGDGVSYGSRPRDAANWREKMLAEVKVDAARTHFTGKIPYLHYRRVLQVSAAHVYLTYPFVLSWSMLEAMASGCLIVGSRTPPVEEVIEDGKNGVLAGFFDHDELVSRILAALNEPTRFTAVRANARETVLKHYSLAQGLAAYEHAVGLPSATLVTSRGLPVSA